MIEQQHIETTCIHPHWLRLKRIRKMLFQGFILFEFLTVIIVAYILITNDRYIEVGPSIVLITLIYLFILGVLINLVKRKSYHQKFRVTEITDPIHLPETFKKKHRWIMHDFRKMYVINNQKIPAKFVEFVEGHRAYTVKPLLEVEAHMTYNLIYIHEASYALIRDQRKRKWIVNIDNLEPI